MEAKMEDAMYVITGATGNTGSVVAQNLLSKGAKVRACRRSQRRSGAYQGIHRR